MSGNLVSATLRRGLFTRIVGKRLLFFQELTSTMDEAARQAESGADEGTVVIAENQTSGRGRQGRNWVSSEGNLYLSVLFRPTLEGPANDQYPGRRSRCPGHSDLHRVQPPDQVAQRCDAGRQKKPAAFWWKAWCKGTK